jgi:hypothetical protein
VPVCAVYRYNRLFHSTGTSSNAWVSFSMFFLMAGYYFLAAVSIPISESQLSQKIGITLVIGFDCAFWSLVVLLLRGMIEKIRGAASSDQRT